MGDASDMSDLERFMRSPEGKARLEEIRQSLVSRTIKAVEFLNNIHAIDVQLALDDDSTFECQHPELDVDTLRDEFDEALEREYYKDYPKRKPASEASK